MGWEHNRYEAACGGCGKTGTVTISSDDWAAMLAVTRALRMSIPPERRSGGCAGTVAI